MKKEQIGTPENSYENRLDKLGREALDRAKDILNALPGKKLILDDPAEMYIDTCNGFIYNLDAKKVLLIDNTIHVFGKDFDLAVLNKENGWDDLQPDEYWCEGGDWYAEWEGLFRLLDKVIAAGSSSARPEEIVS